jgi:hypothetical protein
MRGPIRKLIQEAPATPRRIRVASRIVSVEVAHAISKKTGWPVLYAWMRHRQKVIQKKGRK